MASIRRTILSIHWTESIEEDFNPFCHSQQRLKIIFKRESESMCIIGSNIK